MRVWVGTVFRALGPQIHLLWLYALRMHDVTKCASKKSVFFSKKSKIGVFAYFFCAKPTVLGVLVGYAGQ
jgi:hypothetical protein